MSRLKKLVFVVALLAVTLAACGGNTTETTEAAGGVTPTTVAPEPGETTTAAGGDETATTPAADLPVVRTSALSGGLTAIAQRVIELNGFDVANGWQGDFFYLDEDASFQFFIQRNSDIAFDFDSIGAAIARSRDLDVTVFYPIVKNNPCILVQSDSDYQVVEDLIGQRVGHFGNSSGTTTAMATVLSDNNDINIFEDFELVEAGPAALVELLALGEVEAIFNFVPLQSKAIVEAPARCIFGPLSDFGVNYLAAMTAYDDWLAENEDLALKVMAAWDDAFAWIMEDPTRITEGVYAEALAQDNPEVLALVAQQITDIPLFANEWTPELLEGAEAWIDLAAEQGILIEENPGGVHSILGG